MGQTTDTCFLLPAPLCQLASQPPIPRHNRRPYRTGPRSQGCTSRGRGQGMAPLPCFPAPAHFPWGTEAQFVTPMVVSSGIVSAWPRPQFPELHADGGTNPHHPQWQASHLLLPGRCHPQMDLANLLTGENSTDRAGQASSPSSALHALVDVALDDIRPLASPISLDLSAAGDGQAGGATPAPVPVMLPPPRPKTPDVAVMGQITDACFLLPAPLCQLASQPLIPRHNRL